MGNGPLFARFKPWPLVRLSRLPVAHSPSAQLTKSSTTTRYAAAPRTKHYSVRIESIDDCGTTLKASPEGLVNCPRAWTTLRKPPSWSPPLCRYTPREIHGLPGFFKVGAAGSIVRVISIWFAKWVRRSRGRDGKRKTAQSRSLGQGNDSEPAFS